MAIIWVNPVCEVFQFLVNPVINLEKHKNTCIINLDKVLLNDTTFNRLLTKFPEMFVFFT
jgi:hypothetical protein